MTQSSWTSEERERYARHFALKEMGEEGQLKLKHSRVLVIGAGGLGSAALIYLAAAGVGTIGIADGDRVELSNLQRQVIHSTSGIGERKIDSAAARIREINPLVCVHGIPYRADADNIMDMIRDYDMVVDCVDNFGSKLLISDACVCEKKPFVHSGIIRMEGQLMTYVPGKGPCLRCVMGHAPEPGSYETGASAGVLGASVGILGAMEAQEVIKYLTGMGTLLTGRMLFMDGLTMDIQIQDLGDASPYCPICSREAAPTDLKQFSEEY